VLQRESAAPCGTMGQGNARLLVPVLVPVTLDQESPGSSPGGAMPTVKTVGVFFVASFSGSVASGSSPGGEWPAQKHGRFSLGSARRRPREGDR
jgi:hypothetical protein